jgi:hypothetical protein
VIVSSIIILSFNNDKMEKFCAFGVIGDCNPPQTLATIESNTMIIDENTLNALNKTVSDVGMKTVIENAKSCAGSSVQRQDGEYGNINISGGSKVTLLQEQISNLNFSCIQDDTIQADIVQKMADTLNQQIKAQMSAALQNKLNADVKTKSQSDFLSLAAPTGTTSANQKISNYVKKSNNVNIHVIQNSVYSQFTSKNVSECIVKNIQEQKQKVGNINVSNKSEFDASQIQTANTISSCIQKANIAQRVVSDLAKVANLDVSYKSSTTAKNDASVKAETDAKATGPLQGLSDLAQGIGKGIGNIFGGVFDGLYGLMSLIIYSSSSCCVCICCIFFILMLSGIFSQ